MVHKLLFCTVLFVPMYVCTIHKRLCYLCITDLTLCKQPELFNRTSTGNCNPVTYNMMIGTVCVIYYIWYSKK